MAGPCWSYGRESLLEVPPGLPFPFTAERGKKNCLREENRAERRQRGVRCPSAVVAVRPAVSFQVIFQDDHLLDLPEAQLSPVNGSLTVSREGLLELLDEPFCGSCGGLHSQEAYHTS